MVKLAGGGLVGLRWREILVTGYVRRAMARLEDDGPVCAQDLTARAVLGEGSPLSRALEGYEDRRGQLEMAEAIEDALTGERHLFVEAGTGTGKTLAYLVPALLSGRRVVVSTATLALEEQIFTKDLPLVKRALAAHGVGFQPALMKGLSNYVCKRRLAEALAGSRSPSLSRIEAWERETETGDRSELASLAEDDPAWAQVSSSTDTRIGAECKYYESCHVTAMRREASLADLVVVNHHLFLADLALRTSPRGEYASAIPPYDAVIFDEAHQLESIATEFFGVRVSSARVDALLRDARATLAAAGARASSNLIEQAELLARAFFTRLALEASAEGSARGAGERRPFYGGQLGADLRARVLRLDTALSALGTHASLFARDEGVVLIGRRVDDLRGDLREVLLGDRGASLDEAWPDHDPEFAEESMLRGGRVAWIDVRDRSVALGSSPVDMGPILRRTLFDRVPTVVCTSATLATSDSRGEPGFDFARARLGAPPDTDGLVVASPFDFARVAAFYVAQDLPEPTAPAFEGRATERLVELLDVTGGGAFILCTSLRVMRAFARNLRDRTRHLVLAQGEAPKKLQLGRFRSARDAVLVATMSFWEGVDVPGDALRLVIMDKIPFAVPTDPVVVARSRQIEAEGGNPFAEYTVPQAAITLKQGFGRLVRTRSDRGIVALLDRRARTKSYGRLLLSSLPPARRVDTMEELRVFWSEISEIEEGG